MTNFQKALQLVSAGDSGKIKREDLEFGKQSNP